MTTLGTRIRDARRLAGLSQESLARVAGVSTFTISKLECGGVTDPNSSTLVAIARECGVTTDWLLTGEGDGPDGVHASTVTDRTAPREAC